MTNTDPQITELEARVMMGHQAEQFIKSELGRYIVARSEAEEQKAKDELATADPEDQKLIREYQNQIYRARSIREWFAELIVDGREAEMQLDTPEE